MRWMKSSSIAGVSVATALAMAPAALAWDDAGHQVVAAIAWEEMEPETRRRATEVLTAAPADAGLADLAPQGLPAAERARRHFLLAATWPDRARGGDYDRPGWHWVNYFWREGPDGPIAVPPPVPQAEENLFERLGALSERLADPEVAAAERAIALAWLLHLVGDVHQPFHTSARITAHRDERRGDRGGNTFELHRDPRGDGRVDLHAYWDDLVTENVPRRRRESRADWIDRAAAELSRRHPPEELGPLAAGDFDTWVGESLALAQNTAYHHGLVRDRRPPNRYHRAAWEAAAPAIVKAGHRLAALLDESLARESTTP